MRSFVFVWVILAGCPKGAPSGADPGVPPVIVEKPAAEEAPAPEPHAPDEPVEEIDNGDDGPVWGSLDDG